MAIAMQAPLYPNVLRPLIEHAGYTFREVHQETGIPERTLYDWAAGKRSIPHQDRKNLACLLGCSADDLAPSIPMPRLVQSMYEQGNEQQQGINDMKKMRRLIIQALGITGAVLVTSPQDLLHAEPWERLASALAKPSNMNVDTLNYFGKLVSLSWDLSNKSGLDTVEQLLPTFLPQLSTFAQQPSEYQQTAALLASQGYQLTYIITSHQEDFNAALIACKQAHHYGKLAQDANLQAAALIRQGVTFLNRKRPHQTLESYQKALPLVNQVSPLVRTRLYASLAEVHGKLQHKQDALENIGLSHDSFPDDPQSDPASLYIHFPYSSVYLHEGLALLDLHQPSQAVLALDHVDGLHPKIEISERSRIDVLNQQALAAGLLGDLDHFSGFVEEAITSARKLGSELRVSETWDVFMRMRDQWKYEPQMQSLGGLFAH